MKISLSLIKQFINTDGLSCQQIADLLTMAGIEVEKIENEKPTFSNIVVAKILKKEKHPNADKLSVAIVTDGKEEFQVVCGASNCRANLITAFAKIGSTITDEKNNVIKIKKAKLRDVESFGMLLSEKELNISQDYDGIIELPEEMAIGSDVAAIVDPVFEISLTPNLGHCMNAIGIARELSALTKRSLTPIKYSIEENEPSIDNKLAVDVKDRLCPRYALRIIENIQMVKTPFYITKELTRCGMRSVNVIVDILNYAMLAFGQPMHAFDYKKIQGKTIFVTKNESEKEFLCLDNQVRKIPKDAILIEDEDKTLAIGGIIGGNTSAVDENTTCIVLEAAYFNNISIRKSSKFLDLKN